MAKKSELAKELLEYARQYKPNAHGTKDTRTAKAMEHRSKALKLVNSSEKFKKSVCGLLNGLTKALYLNNTAAKKYIKQWWKNFFPNGHMGCWY